MDELQVYTKDPKEVRELAAAKEREARERPQEDERQEQEREDAERIPAPAT